VDTDIKINIDSDTDTGHDHTCDTTLPTEPLWWQVDSEDIDWMRHYLPQAQV
jgi:hypothetical protein